MTSTARVVRRPRRPAHLAVLSAVGRGLLRLNVRAGFSYAPPTPRGAVVDELGLRRAARGRTT